MEYSPALKLYTSRLYFTETRGGVLGANAMQGKRSRRNALARVLFSLEAHLE